jgi:hypothetical protein
VDLGHGASLADGDLCLGDDRVRPALFNLTYRGVLTNGPYAFTRHPAYLSKNLFWWLVTLPFLATTHSKVDAVRNTVTLALVSAVYFWRAKTEEKHLLGEDAKYRAYHAWMAEHGLITRPLGRLLRVVVGRSAAGFHHPRPPLQRRGGKGLILSPSSSGDRCKTG